MLGDVIAGYPYEELDPAVVATLYVEFNKRHLIWISSSRQKELEPIPHGTTENVDPHCLNPWEGYGTELKCGFGWWRFRKLVKTVACYFDVRAKCCFKFFE